MPNPRLPSLSHPPHCALNPTPRPRHDEPIVRIARVANAGAVNTLIPLADGRIRGDNTDWLGIRACLERHARARARAGGDDDGADGAGGLVLGAGGTARAALFALHAMGVSPLYTWNRTASKAEALAQEFGAQVRARARTSGCPRSLACARGDVASTHERHQSA